MSRFDLPLRFGGCQPHNGALNQRRKTMRQKNTFLAALTILGFASLNLVHAGSSVLWSSAGSAGQVDPACIAFAKTSRSEITMSTPGRLVIRYSVAPSAELANVYGTLHLTGSFTDPGKGASVTLQLREDDVALDTRETLTASSPRVILSVSSKDGASIPHSATRSEGAPYFRGEANSAVGVLSHLQEIQKLCLQRGELNGEGHELLPSLEIVPHDA
jgi:hypothetical protein